MDTPWQFPTQQKRKCVQTQEEAKERSTSPATIFCSLVWRARITRHTKGRVRVQTSSPVPPSARRAVRCSRHLRQDLQPPSEPKALSSATRSLHFVLFLRLLALISITSRPRRRVRRLSGKNNTVVLLKDSG